MNCLVRTRRGFEPGALEIREDCGVLRVRTDGGTIHAGARVAAYVSDLAFVTPGGTAIFMEDRSDFDGLYERLSELGWIRLETRGRLRRVPSKPAGTGPG